MNYQELQQWLASHGGWKESIPTTEQSVNPLTKLPEDKAVTMVVAADGSSIRVQVSGTGTKPEENTYTVIGEPKLTAPARSASTSETVPSPPTQPNLVTRNPDGSLKTDPNPNYTPPASAIDPPKEKDEGGRRYVWNEKTQQWEDVGAAPENPTEAAHRKETESKTDAARKENETKKNTWHDVGTDTVVDETTGVTKEITHQENGLGEKRDVPSSKQVTKAPEKPTLVDLPNGGKGQLVPNPEKPGTFMAVPVEGTQGERSQIPLAGDIQGQLGDLVPNAMKRRDELTAIYNAGGMDKATYEKQAAQIMADANSRQVELNNLLTQQNNIQTQQGNQRGQTINESSTNTNFSSSALDRAMKHTLTPYGGGPGSGETSARALQSLLKMQSDYARANGGLSQTTPVQPTAFQKHVLTIDPSGSIKIETGAGGGGVVPDVGAGTGLPGAGVGPNGESLTRPGFSEGMDLSSIGSMMSQGNPIPAGPDPTELMQDLQDDSDPDWMNAIAMNGAEAMGGVA